MYQFIPTNPNNRNPDKRNAKYAIEPKKTVISLTPAMRKSSVGQLPTQASACLLKTAIATISSSDISLEGNILIDEGAQ